MISDNVKAAELGALSTLLAGYHDSGWETASSLVCAEDFYSERHRVIFRAIAAVGETGQEVGIFSVGEALGRQLNSVGGWAALAEMAEQRYSAADLEAQCRLVRRAHSQRQLRAIGGELSEASSLDGISDAQEKLGALDVGNGSDISEGLGKLALDRITEIDRLISSGETVPSTLWGFKALDDYIGGRKAGRYYVVGARPAMGKSAFAQCSAVEAAKNGEGQIFVSLEMSSTVLADRLNASESGVPYMALQDARLSGREIGAAAEAAMRLYKLPLRVICKSAGYPVDACCDAIRAAHQTSAVTTAWIDYAQYLSDGARTVGSREQEIASVSRKLKSLATDLGIQVVALAQLNRGVEQRADKRPVQSDMRESGGLEQDADCLILLYRDEYYHPDTPDKGTAEVIIGKNRHGPTGIAHVAFHGPTLRFGAKP